MYDHTDVPSSLHTFMSSIDALLTPLTDEQIVARKTGLQSYKLGEYLDAETNLTIAATAGDRDSQYALGEAIRRREGRVSEAAKIWYRMAADQNHVYSLMRLGDDDSTAKARVLAEAGAEVDDSDSLLQMYELTQDIDWLRKAGSAGNGEADYIRAILYDKGLKPLPPNTNLESIITPLLSRSAYTGFPPAMYWLSNGLRVQNIPEIQRRLLRQRLEKNQLSAVKTYAYALLGIPTLETSPDRYRFRYDVVSGYGLLWLIVNRTRQYAGHADAAETLATTSTTLTSQQIEDAKQFALTWEKTHPPLSIYALTYSNLT